MVPCCGWWSGGACCGRVVVRFVHCTAVGSGEKRRPKFELGIPTRAVHEHNNNPGVCAGISKIACNAIAHLAARWCVHVRTPKYTQPNCNPLRSRVHYLPILRLHATSNMHLLRCSTVGRVVVTKNRSVVGKFGRFQSPVLEQPK